MSQKKHNQKEVGEEVVKTARTTTNAVVADEEENEPRKYLSLRRAAIKVLSEASAEGMTPKEIYASAVAEGFVDPIRKGKTPQATLSAAFYTEIKTKRDKSTFIKVGKGRFALNPNNTNGHDGEVKNEDSAPLDKSPEKPTRFTLLPKRRALLPSNTHPKCKMICGARKKVEGGGNQICRIPWTGQKHEGDHVFEPFRRGLSG